MNIKQYLRDLRLTPANSIVIGSGILSALAIRESNDIDLVVDPNMYNRLSQDSRFEKKVKREKEILVWDLFEIGTSWTVVGKKWSFDDLLDQSIIIDDVRYNSIEFLLAAKEDWVKNDDIVRQKDLDDIKLMKEYLGNSS